MRHVWAQSAGGTSSGTEEDSSDDDLNVKKNTKWNEIFLSSSDQARKEENESGDEEDLRQENQRLKDKLEARERYIKELEEKLRQIELTHKDTCDSKSSQ